MLLMVSADHAATGLLGKWLEMNGLSDLRGDDHRLPRSARFGSGVGPDSVGSTAPRDGGSRRDQFPSTVPIIVLQPFDKSCGQMNASPSWSPDSASCFVLRALRALLAHIQAILRRQQMPAALHLCFVPKASRWIPRAMVKVGGTLVELTPKNFVSFISFCSRPALCCPDRNC
ncbi:MAG: hypothetical protein MRJ92_10430 [Nitrospira sp.]|nr:hypothetical protein [Nitrospira sp.]